MKFSCYKSDLLDALKLVVRSVAVKPTVPILAGIYLKADGSTLELQSNNIATGTMARIPISCERPGEVVIGGSQFVKIIARLPDDTLTIELTDNQLEIRSGGSLFEMNLLGDIDDFPQGKEIEGKSVSIKATVLKEITSKTAFAVAKDDVRPIFKGVYLEIGDGAIRATTTNTHRLAHFETSAPIDSEVKAVVPVEALKNLLVALPTDDTQVAMTINAKHVAFAFNNFYVTGRIYEGLFPDYKKVVPKVTPFQIKVNRLELKQALERVNLVLGGKDFNSVVLITSTGSLTLTGQSDYSRAQEVIEVEGGGDLEISFNINYLLDYLTTTSGKDLTIKFGEDRYSPILFTEEGINNYIYVVTPTKR